MKNMEWYMQPMAQKQGTVWYMYSICCVPFLFGKPLVKNTFSNPFPKKRSDCESQKSGFGFDLKTPPWEYGRPFVSPRSVELVD